MPTAQDGKDDVVGMVVENSGKSGEESGTPKSKGTVTSSKAGGTSANKADDGSFEEVIVPLDWLELGGPIDEPAFALLDGLFEDPSDEASLTRVTIPITRLPAVLGRTHVTSDKHFFGLGRNKAVSRQQCVIYYRDADGGRVGMYQDQAGASSSDGGAADADAKGDDKTGDKSDTLVYLPKPADNGVDLLLRPTKEENGEPDPLPKTGFFTIECLGKNRILVDGIKLDQGRSVPIRSGSTIRISSYMLYFLLPTDVEPTRAPEAVLTKLRRSSANNPVSDDESNDDSGKGGGTDSDADGDNADNDNDEGGRRTPTNKGPTASSGKRKEPDVVPSSNAETEEPKVKKLKSGQLYQAELDALPTEELRQRMTDAIEENIWERKHQLIGSTVVVRAVMDAAHSKTIQVAARDMGGVTRSQILDWIASSSSYSVWVTQMLSRMEERSYQASITKALNKAGYTRLNGSGRYVRWKLPEGIPSALDEEEDDSVDEVDENEDGDDENENEKQQGDEGEGGGDDEDGENSGEEGNADKEDE